MMNKRDMVTGTKMFCYILLRETERERNIDVRETSIGCLLYVPDWGPNLHPSMCPDWELNWQPFALWDDTRATEPHRSRLKKFLI